MSQLSEKILKYLGDHEEVNTITLANNFNEDHQKVIGTLKSIQANGDLILADSVSEKKFELTEEGQTIVENGSYEVNIFKAVPENGILQSELMKLGNAKIGFSKAMSCGWIFFDKAATPHLVKRKVSSVVDTVQEHLLQIMKGDFSKITDKEKQEYKKRKLIQEIVMKRKGPEFNLTLTKLETDLTSDMLISGTWQNLKFKEYNFNALGIPLECGYLHPLLKVRSEFRQIFLEMGFSEMPTNNYIENSFWNFDALFQPQQHPARDAHDTFFISDPKISNKFPKDYLERVKKVHSNGGYGSQGYGYDWRIEEAQKNLLRTHTTAVSARMLYKAAQLKEFKPIKLFSIDKYFKLLKYTKYRRKEGYTPITCCTVNYKECQFNSLNSPTVEQQTDMICINCAESITELEFKPAYNPYTEPSMEIFCFHPGLGKWIEIGNSGVFRPEMLLPMGLPEDVCVIAWGLSLERPTMIKYGFNNIRDLVGPKVDLEMVQKTPICRLNK
ncbi:hypothetical protein NQ317_008845 [Molorchus minor]|uniref:phenylalanine--tRNA ligase n=1 Tax=Molorchus minor TaxID=1323400 RepID=A0ABQ9IVT8_9CUCU|nr:hypothetical protein NQ317_008845 [Molorchus minor]